MKDTNSSPGAARRLLPLGAVLGIVAAGLGAAFGGASDGVGAGVGALVAAFYAMGYLRTHLRERQRVIDRSVAQSTVMRLGAVAIGGALAAIAGKSVFIWYLSSFAIGFAISIASEIPRTARDLRQRGMLGGGKPS